MKIEVKRYQAIKIDKGTDISLLGEITLETKCVESICNIDSEPTMLAPFLIADKVIRRFFIVTMSSRKQYIIDEASKDLMVIILMKNC